MFNLVSLTTGYVFAFLAFAMPVIAFEIKFTNK